MTEFVGRSGADAVFKALHKICLVVTSYGPKLDTAIGLTQTAGLITSDQASAARLFLTSANAACDIFKIIAGNSGF